MAETHRMTLGGAGLRVAPEEMRWSLRPKVADQAGVGGKVIQILGIVVDDITLRGTHVPDWRQGDVEAAEQAERFRLRIRDLARRSADDATTPPVRLTYPPRGWDFNVYVKSITPVNLTITTIAPKWELVLVPIGDSADKVVKGIKDLYIKRMMDGIGWKQTSYNGPMTQSLVDEFLGGQSVEDFYAQGLGDSFAGDGTGQ